MAHLHQLPIVFHCLNELLLECNFDESILTNTFLKAAETCQHLPLPYGLIPY